MARVIVTLSTDFGRADSYAAQLKGVLLSQGPDALWPVDLSHELPAHDVLAAALFLEAALPRFPDPCIHLCVVDPGVGSARAPLVVCHGQGYLVGPDNGVFALVAEPGAEAFAIDPGRVGSATASATFHGRDLFAPAAAALARGVLPGAFATPLEGPMQRLAVPAVQVDGTARLGEVIHVDHFGNLITNLTTGELAAFDGPVRVSLQDRPIGPLSHHYAQVPMHAPLALIGSGGRLEIAANQCSARDLLAAGVGSRVRVSPA